MDSRFCFKNLFLTMMFLLMELIVGLTAQRFKHIDVRTFGAIADGKTDNTQAFLKAWNLICGLVGNHALLVPKTSGVFMLRQVTFKGPCKGRVQFNLRGTIRAFNDKSAIFTDSWIVFHHLNYFEMNGGGTFDGQGAAAWRFNKCGRGPCPKLPVTLIFNYVNNSIVDDIRSINSRGGHIHMWGCRNFTFQHLTIKAPMDSPNTDGMDIGGSYKINVLKSTIATGDDCIALLSGIQDIRIEGVTCGPGHGISVGSLGKEPVEEDLKGLTVKNCTLIGTLNGLRIKSWQSPVRLKAYNFTFDDIIMENVQNPITIDQNYCPYNSCSKRQASHVSIDTVSYTNIRGTSATEVAVSLRCSRAVPCKNIILKDIDMTGNKKQSLKSSCSFAQGASFGVQNPKACI